MAKSPSGPRVGLSVSPWEITGYVTVPIAAGCWRAKKTTMTNVQAAEVLRDLGEALAEGPTIRVRAVRATLRALAMAVVALEAEPVAVDVLAAGYPTEAEEET